MYNEPVMNVVMRSISKLSFSPGRGFPRDDFQQKFSRMEMSGECFFDEKLNSSHSSVSVTRRVHPLQSRYTVVIPLTI